MATKVSPARREQCRKTVCIGCWYNRYNYQSDGDQWNAPTTGDGCWFLSDVKRGKCSMYQEER